MRSEKGRRVNTEGWAGDTFETQLQDFAMRRDLGISEDVYRNNAVHPLSSQEVATGTCKSPEQDLFERVDSLERLE